MTIVAAAFSFTACSFDLSSPVTGRVELHSTFTKAISKELSVTQLREISAWFSQRQSGWKPSWASYFPSLIIRIQHGDGDVTVINVLEDVVVVYNRNGQYSQQFSTTELAALRGMAVGS